MPVLGGNTIDHAAKVKGMVADSQLINKISKLNKTGSTIAFGLGVVSDGEDASKLPTGAETALQFNGVVKHELNRAYTDGATFGAPTGYDMTVVTEGVVWVTVLDTVAKDAQAYLRVGSTDVGNWSGIVGAGVTLGTLIPNAKFLTGGNAGELVKLSLGLGG